jgi:hypothetical protein
MQGVEIRPCPRLALAGNEVSVEEWTGPGSDQAGAWVKGKAMASHPVNLAEFSHGIKKARALS